MPDPSSMQSPAGSADGQQPPFGNSPATGPTPNAGLQVAAGQQMGVVIKALEKILPLAGSQSEMGQAILKALKDFAKYVPAGSVTPAAEANQLQAAQIRNVQNGQNAALMQKQQAQQGGGAAAAGP